MDRSWVDGRMKQRCGYQSSDVELHYDVVDDHEIVHNVHIFPARPIYDEREYADRGLPRSSSGQSLMPVATGNSNIHPKYPPREILSSTGPAVNRQLKPGRRKIRPDDRFPPTHQREQPSRRCPPSPPVTLEIETRLPGLTLQESGRRNGKRATKNAEFSPPTKGLQSNESAFSSYTNQRHSLDLESQQIDKRSQDSLERVLSKRHHHEWPQTKEDIDQNDFVPIEKPHQMYYEEDWYIGACSRADAEHALHLVNKDGAFLVRDCSIITNSEPLVLAVYHEKKVYNVKIRFIEGTNKYALGTTQRSNDMFNSVADIIKFHSIFPIVLISGRSTPGSKYPENCVLTCPVTKRDVDQLLE
ncbi:cytokine-dependent hematopoietic cell linker isoform X2 [Sphaeramia orbicularis]|uniref:cytokine-dependent hematopoietic cell linker isoform X2 n=1 Tax=Sphaeramia orbicularis TaxID=375764 RepID=UPI00118134B8|nr:cytokine-dependent hematopoietic cell linker isoform X2 [Sphaeramia orbicularis]